MNYTEFSTEDFIWDEDFRRWVLEPDADADIFWSEWIDKNPDKEAQVDAGRQLLKAIKIKDMPLSDYEVKLAINNILHEVQLGKNLDRKRQGPWYFINSKKYLGIAASLILILGVVSIIYIRKPVTPSLTNLVNKVNHGTAPLQIDLEDGTKIILKENATISYASNFDDQANRKVYLKGEADFDVAKDAGKPFFVYANGLITKVLGTKFKIRSYAEEENSFVEVSSGIVAVYSLLDKNSEDEHEAQKLNSIILTRNQKANYSNEDRTIMAAVIEKPVAVNNQIFDYTFSDTPIRKIFENIEEGYGIDIIYDEKLLGNRTFTANLSHKGMYEKLDIICKVINTHYEMIDGKIIIYPDTN